MQYTIGIDLGGTNLKIGLLKNGHLIENTSLKALSAVGLKAQLPEIEHAIDQMFQANGVSVKDVLGIGLSFAGLVDSSRSVIMSTNKKYEDAIDIDLTEWAKEKWGIGFCMENDARMALLGEWQHGRGKGF